MHFGNQLDRQADMKNLLINLHLDDEHLHNVLYLQWLLVLRSNFLQFPFRMSQAQTQPEHSWWI